MQTPNRSGLKAIEKALFEYKGSELLFHNVLIRVQREEPTKLLNEVRVRL